MGYNSAPREASPRQIVPPPPGPYAMSVDSRQADAEVPLEIVRRIDAICDRLEEQLQHGGEPSLGPLVEQIEPPWRERLLEELAQVALGRLREQGAAHAEQKLLAANPRLEPVLRKLADDASRTIGWNESAQATKVSGLVVRCPLCRNPVELVIDASLVDIVCRSCGGSFSLVDDSQQTREAATVANVAHFELIERLGMGEFGTVWKARDTVLDRTVALKLPRRQQLDAAEAEKFLREAQAAAQLSHPNIVSIHEIGRHGDMVYIVCDYVRGAPLSELISERSVGVRAAVAMTAKMAAALEYAHRQGIVHRDLKPSNILIDDAGEPRLMDFGLAKRRETEATVTVDGAILGTPAYMSPEQARGEAWRADGRSDVYSLGVILFQLLTSELPFRGSLRVLLHKVIHEDPPGPRWLDSNIDRDLDTICLKCLEKDPGRRYQTAGDLAADLRRFLADEPVTARRVGRLGRSLRWARRNPGLMIAAIAVLVTLLGATAVSSYFGWRAAQNALLADERAEEIADQYYQSLLSEIRLTRQGRKQGYAQRVRELVRQARKLESTLVDDDQLRRELVLTLGDFAGREPVSLSSFDAEVRVFRLSRDGALLLAGLDNGHVLICDLTAVNENGRRRRLAQMDGTVLAVALSPRADRLLALDQTGRVRVWRRSDQAWIEEAGFRLPRPVALATFSAGGELLAWADAESLEVWNVIAGNKLRSLPVEPPWSLRNLAFDPQGVKLAGSYQDPVADRVGWAAWNVASGERLHAADLPSLGNSYLHGLAWTREGDRLAIGFDEALLVYDMTSFEPVKFTGFDATKAVAFGENAPYLAAVNIRGAVNIWNFTNDRHIAVLQVAGVPLGRNCVAFSAADNRLVASQANEIRVWDLRASDEQTVLDGHQGGIPAAAFHPTAGRLATGGKDNRVRLWKPTGELHAERDIGEAVQTLAFSPDGRRLAVGSMGPESAPHLRLLNADSLAIELTAAPDMGEVYSLVWAESNEGQFLAGCGRRGVALWKVQANPSPALKPVLALPRDYCLAAVLAPHRRWMLWAERERYICGWDFAASRELAINAPEMHQGWHGLALLPQSENVFFISRRGKAEIWNVAGDHRVADLGEADKFAAPHVAASPQGGWLAALTEADTVAVWGQTPARHVFSLRPESGTVWSLAWDPTGQHLAVGQSDGGLAVWHLDKIQEELRAVGLAWPESSTARAGRLTPSSE